MPSADGPHAVMQRRQQQPASPTSAVLPRMGPQLIILCRYTHTGRVQSVWGRYIKRPLPCFSSIAYRHDDLRSSAPQRLDLDRLRSSNRVLCRDVHLGATAACSFTTRSNTSASHRQCSRHAPETFGPRLRRVVGEIRQVLLTSARPTVS